MPRANRLSVTLTDLELERLRRLAAREQKTPATIAGLLIAGGLQRELQHAIHETEDGQLAVWPAEMHEVASDIVHALQVEGVPAVLAGHRHAASTQAILAANYLELISAWLSDPAPRLARGAPIRLAEVTQLTRPGGGVVAALELAGGADERHTVPMWGHGSPGTSDKRTLSDIGENAGGEEI